MAWAGPGGAGQAWPRGVGEMAARVRAHDWATTRLGPPATWPAALRTAAEMVLEAPGIASLAAGPDRLLIYNDRAAGHYGDRHPGALGRPIAETFADQWPLIRGFYDRAFAGEAVRVEAQPVDSAGEGVPEVYDADLTPVRGEDGEVIAAAVAFVAAGERLRATAALRESERRFRSLFERMDQGFCVLERVEPGPEASPGAPPGEHVDFRYVLCNPAFGRHTGLGDPVGRTIRSVVAEPEPSVMAVYDRVARTRRGERFEAYVTPLDLWMDAEAVPADAPGQVAVLFTNIGERKRTEARLREAEERQRFLLRLSDALRPLADPMDIMAAASEALGRHLGVGRCGYCEVDEAGEHFTIDRDWTDGVMPSLKGRHLFAGFGPDFVAAYRAGQTVMVEDALADARAAGAEAAYEAAGGVRAGIGLPLLKGGRFVAAIYVQQLDPRRWTAEDETLVRDVAERTWAAVERARAEAALRQSEERLRVALAAADLGAWTWHVAEDRTEADARALAHFGLPADAASTLAEALATTIHPEDRPRYAASVARAVDPSGPGTLVEEFRIRRPDGEERWMAVSATAAFEGAPPAARLTGVLADVTERKATEARLRESEERGAFLLRLSDALRAESGVEAVGDRAVRMIADRLGLDRVYLVTVTPGDDSIVVTHEARRTDLPPLLGAYRGSDFPEAMREIVERTIVYDDVRTDPRLSDLDRRSLAGLGAVGFIGAPIRRGAGTMIWAAGGVSTEPRSWSGGDVALFEDAVERTWAAVERARAEARLRETEAQMRAFGEASSDVLWIRDAATLQWTYLSPAFERIYGMAREDALGGDTFRTWLDLIVPEDRAEAEANIARARAGERVGFEYCVRRPSDGAIRTLRNSDFPIRDAGGRVLWIGGVGHDATEEVALRGRLGVLVAELQHRTRNLMGVILGLMRRTLARSPDLPGFARAFESRLQALARVQGLLSRLDAGQRIDFGELVRAELGALGALDGGRVALDGPEGVRLRSSTVQTLALALHELATNALKHGALAVPAGRLRVSWRRVPGGRLRVDWIEEGVPIPPEVAASRASGYGLELIEKALPYQLGAETRLEMSPDGVRCAIVMPLSTTEGLDE